MKRAARLLRWYDRARRDLPWRKTRDPYAIWLSEVMLQQTTVAAVIPHWERFLGRFPTVESLAAAAEEDVLAEWSGLGYYSRARLLHRAAKAVVAAGGMPRTAEELRRLPGFGPYTSAAVASIAFGEAVPVVDGNVVRVVARLHALPGHARDPKLLAAVGERDSELLDRTRPGDSNQAVMELGATICRPGSPDCPACPLLDGCLSAADGSAAERPGKPPRRAKATVRLACGALLDEGHVLVRTRRADFLDGLPELPTLEDGDDVVPRLRKLFREAGFRVESIDRLATVRQVVTHRNVELTVYAIEGSAARLSERSDFRWLTIEGRRIELPALFRKAAELALREAGAPSLFRG